MMPYLIEPYNAWDKTPKKKKHFHELIEEEQLMARIIAEQQAAQQQIQNTAIAAAGAGGTPPWEYFNPSADIIDFSATPSTGVGPFTVIFTNLTTSPTYDTYTWNFGDGQSSNVVSPTHFYSNTGSYTASLTVSYQDGTSAAAAASNLSNQISSSVPRVVSAYTATSNSLVGPITVSFTNTSTNNSTQATSSYLWDFGDNTTSTLESPNAHVYTTGSYTVTLRHTGSYSASMVSRTISASVPVLVSSFSMSLSSGTAPSTASFIQSSSYNGNGTLTYLWSYGSGSVTTTATTASSFVYSTAGGYTASLQVTESSLNFARLFTRSFVLA